MRAGKNTRSGLAALGPWAQIDKEFAVLVAVSVAMHFGTAFLLGAGDRPYEAYRVSALSDVRVASVFFPEPLAPDAPEPILTPFDKGQEPSEQVAQEAPPSEERAVDPSAELPAEDRPSWASDRTRVDSADRAPAPSTADDGDRPSLDPDLRARAALLAAQQMIGSVMDEEGAFTDLLREGAPAASQQDVLAHVDGVEIARADPGSMTHHIRGPTVVQRGSLHTLALPPAGEGPEFVPEGEHILEAEVPPEVITCCTCYLPWRGDPPEPAVVRALRAALPRVRQCYERALRQRPDQGGGRLTVRVTVQDAVVTSVTTAEDTLRSPQVRSCVIRVIERLTMPPYTPPEETVVDLPFVFSPRR